MPGTYFDSEGNEIELPTPEEYAELQKERESLNSERDTLKEQLDAAESGSEGFKSLREAIKRKDAEIAKLKETPKPRAEEPKEDEPKVEKKEPEVDIDQRLDQKLTMVEVNRDIASYTAEEKDAIKGFFNKLTAGEQVNVENYGSYLSQAVKLAIPDANARVKPPSRGGRPPRNKGDKQDFSETNAGKGLASKLGLNIK